MLREFLLNFSLSVHSEELTGGWRKWHDQQLYILYSSPNAIYLYDETKDSDMGWTVSMQELDDKFTQNFGSRT
jgi:hypothetical protein